VTSVKIVSFGYLHGSAPTPAHVTLDARTLLRDPHVDPAFRELTGQDHRVQHRVLTARGASRLIDHLQLLTEHLLVLRADDEPVTVAIGCAGGRHRSVVLAKVLSGRLLACGWDVDVEHRDINKPVVHRG
jgi:UPF0042 nucleotide-binding protein